jgi:hypothetical protein
VRVSRLLGHSSPTITLDVYSHILPKEHYGSADRLAALVIGNKLATSEKPTHRPRKCAIESETRS